MLNKEMKIAAILSYITMGLAVVIALVTTPLIVKALGQNEYGVYALFGSLIATLTMFDLGLNNTVVRYVSRYQAEKKHTEQARFLGLVALVYIIISLFVMFSGYVVYQNLSQLFPALKADELDLAKQIFVILIASLTISLPGGMFTAIANAYERFLLVRAVNLVKLVFRTLILLTVLNLYGDALSIVIMDTIFTILTICIMAYYSIVKIGVRINFNGFTLSLFKKVFGYSIWIFVFAMYQQIQWESGKLILGSSIGAKEVAVYALGVMLALYYSGLATSILSMFLPKANQILANDGSIDEFMSAGKSISRIILKILVPVIVLFFFYGEEFVLLWLGAEYKQVYVITLTIMLLYLPALLQGFMGSLLQALDKVKERALISLFGALFGVCVSLLLVPEYSINGVLIGLAVGWAVTQVMLNILYLYLEIPAYKMLAINKQEIIFIVILVAVNFIIDKFVYYDLVIQLCTKLFLSLVFNLTIFLIYKFNYIYKLKALIRMER